MMTVSLMGHSEPLAFTNGLSVDDTTVGSKAIPPRFVAWPPAKQTELPDVVAEDPAATGFVPKVLIMTGKILEIRTTGYPIEWCGDSFELAVLDPTNYYYKEWRNKGDKALLQIYGSRIYVIQGESFAEWGCMQPRWGDGVDCGGGKSSTRQVPLMLPARDFWANYAFIGVEIDNLKLKTGGGFYDEEYSDLKKFGPYYLPCKMALTMRLGPREVLTKKYIVEKIIFSKEPDIQWLNKINEKHSENVSYPATTHDAKLIENQKPVWKTPTSRSAQSTN
jgi:hypothetical protein